MNNLQILIFRIKTMESECMLLNLYHKFRLLCSTDLLWILSESWDFSRHAHILNRKINQDIFYAKDCFANKLSEDAQ